jgi:tetratricopeptide (TPR) repeat protein
MKVRNVLLLSLLCIFSFACRKSAFLNSRPDLSLIVPSTIADCQQLLDDDVVMNGYGNAGYPSLGVTGCDDYYVSSSQYAGYSVADQRAAVWASDIYAGGEVNDWDLPYRVVFYANEVIEVLSHIDSTGGQATGWNNAMGMALFYRAFAYYQLAQLFSPVYDSATARTDWGLPLRLSADVHEKINRSTVQQTYDQILRDLSGAIRLLPKKPDWYPTRPARAAAYGLLSRVYISSRDYPMALLYADSCLQIHPGLLDYNTADTSALFPFTRTNPEVIFSAACLSSGPSAIGKSFTDSALFNAYQTDDLRQKLFFRNGRYFFGRYDQNGYPFGGIAADEMWLTRAECYARAGQTAAAMSNLDSLLQTRWRTGTFTPVIATDADDALLKILAERRKELLYRGLRWTDLRRLNKEPRLAITLYRTVNGQTYTLPPNAPRYVYAIPDNVLSFNPGMPQNPR